MARPIRLQYPGAHYHVIARGDRRKEIFLDDIDRRHFLNILRYVARRRCWRIHAYCLMDNHYHILIETTEPNLSEGMRDLNGIYSQRFNRRHDVVGHLFSGRYKSFLIETDTYLLEVARYIVLNPVRAEIVRDVSEWKWSSYREMRTQNSDGFLTRELLRAFSGDDPVTQYEDFVAKGVGGEAPHTNMREGSILGSPEFLDNCLEYFGEKGHEKEYPRGDRYIDRPTLEWLFDGELDQHARNEAIWVARENCGYKNVEIGRFLKLDPSTIGKIVKSFRENYAS